MSTPALQAAEEAQAKVEACLDARQSFRLEAGAGAGKTYSLVEALKKLIAERGPSLLQAGQQVACITFTEVARNEIAQEVEDHPAILVQTIHAFCWAFMAPFQPALRELVAAKGGKAVDKIEAGGGVGEKPVQYDFGHFNVRDDEITLHHDDVPVFMAKLIALPKFRRLLTQKFPVIFIDEYQDTNREFMEAINTYMFGTEGSPLVGLFGDHWQTIHRSEYDLADYPIQAIDKGSNFRSVQPIVNVLNVLRPELEQVVSDPRAPGEARFFHANAFVGERTNTSHSKQDLLPDQARVVREKLMARLEREGWDRSRTKILMLTHNVLAAEQGYPGIAAAAAGWNDQFVKLEDPALKMFAETVEPMCAAYTASNYGEMFAAYGEGPTLRAHEDKVSWRTDMDGLLKLRLEGNIGNVIDHLKATCRPPLSSRVLKREEDLIALKGNPVPEENESLQRHQRLREVPYTEVTELLKFIEGSTPFATQHSVKGAEFDNVLVVLGGGWNHYNWPRFLELVETKALDNKNTNGFLRARNLFYVAISRPRKKLAVLATQTLSENALKTAVKLFGANGVEQLPLEQLSG
ncbi:UvrD-helicase domain-containing protein [Bacillus sp. NP157]|nr:UvrD-helicase domain-containing protein [Bacillus sp. NP157]